MKETQIQAMAVNWFRRQYPQYKKHLQASGNGNFRGAGIQGVRSTQKAKKEGMVVGQSDLFLAVPRGEYHGKFIEVKTEKGRATQHQKDFLEDMQAAGYAAEIVKGLDNLIASIQNYMEIE